MAQIKFPAEFEKQVSLQKAVYEKNTELSAESPLAAWLTEQNIDLAADQDAGEKATEQENIRAQQDALAKTSFSARDEKHNGVMSFIRPAAQALKNFYKPNFATLADWGLPVTDSGRIAYPSSFDDANSMAASFFTKLASYDEGKSPLAVFIKTNDVNVADLSKDNTSAATLNATAQKATKAAENATEKRDLLWKDPLAHLHAIADYLKSIYPANPRELGEWGYVVDESDRKPKLRKSKLKLGETKIVTGVAIGSILTNTGKKEIIVYQGKGTTGAATHLNSGDKMGILKGYSVITVVNSSTLENGEFTVEMNK